MKIVNWIFCCLFFLSAVFQYNDPDPVIWILMWGAAGAACLFFGIGKLPMALPVAMAAIGLIWALALFPKILETSADIRWREVFMQASMSNITVEWVREMGGLLIISAWMGVLVFLKRKKSV